MAYNVKYTDTNKTPISVDPATELSTALDVSLFGRVKTEYGEELNENLYHLMENFACPEQDGNPGNPDLVLAYNDLLENPTEGQIWFNATQETLFFWDGTKWIALGSDGDYAANWGRICHDEQLPQPVSAATGYVFPYEECIWAVAPANYTGEFDYMACATDNQANVTMQYRLTADGSVLDGICNYLIIGIRGNNNNGTLETPSPIPSPTPTPSTSVGVTVTPTPAASSGVTPTPAASSTPAPSVTPTSTPAPGVTSTPAPSSTPAASVTPTPTTTVTPTPTVTPTVTITPTITVTPSASAVAPISIETTDNFQNPGNPITGVSGTCNINNYTVSADDGITNCGTDTFGACALNECAPEPGDDNPGPQMTVTVSGGVAPYTVRIKNVTGNGSLPAGECFDLSFPSGTLIDNSTSSAATISTFVIATDGGTQAAGSIQGSCDTNIFAVSGDFDIEVEDDNGTIETLTRSWSLSRFNTV